MSFRTKSTITPSSAFTGLLHDHGIRVSMDGKGWRDNVFIERLWRSIK